MPPPNEFRDEEIRLRRVRLIVDFTSNLIMQSGMARGEAERLVHVARLSILELFPGRDQTFDLLYARRFRRLIDEFTVSDFEGRPS